MSREFVVTDEQLEKIKNWHPDCHYIWTGAIGGGETYSFMPTGLGDCLVFTCKCGERLNLTDYESW